MTLVTFTFDMIALVDALETQLATSRATGEKLLTALVAELAGIPRDNIVIPSLISSNGRCGRPLNS